MGSNIAPFRKVRSHDQGPDVFERENWVFQIRGRAVTVRVEVDGRGGGELLRYSMDRGPTQWDLAAKVASRKEARLWLEARIWELLGPQRI